MPAMEMCIRDSAYINLDASGMAIWDLRIKNYPISLRYQVNLPFAGVMFCPNYGQSYYEIFTLGNWGGVINFTSLHNQPSLRQMLTVDFPVGRAKMRLAYLWDAQPVSYTHLKIGIYIISRAGGVLIYLIVTNSHFALSTQSVRQTN